MNTAGNGNQLVVAQVIESMTMGGAENLAVRIANALAAAGQNSHLIIMGEPGILSERISPNVTAHYLEFERASVNNPPAFALSLRRGSNLLKRIIEQNQIQVIQTHLPGSNFWGLLMAYRNVCPVLATIHNNQEFKYGDQDNPLRAAFRKKAYQLILKKCAGTVAVSEEVKLSLIRDLGASNDAARRISVVTNGVDIPQPISSETRSNILSALGVDSGRPLILAAGRFSEQKNFVDLIKAADQLRSTHPDFQMVIAGDGPQWPGIQAQVQELGLAGNVFLPGNLINLNEVMLAADIFTMSSLWEGLPLVLLEAMAAGLPAVAYCIAGIHELIENNIRGLKVETGNFKALADGLGGMLSRPEERKVMGLAARSLVENQFNFSVLMDRLQELYSQVSKV